MTVGVLGGEASYSLLTGVSQSNVFGVLVNDFFVFLDLQYTLQYSFKVCY